MLLRRQTDTVAAYPDSFDESDEPSFFDNTDHIKISRPLSVPGSPRERSGMMTPGDFASLQEGREGLSTDDYIAWKLPEEEEVEEYPFPLTLKQKKAAMPGDGTASETSEATTPLLTNGTSIV